MKQDSWFYNQGITNILDKRKIILEFLDFVSKKDDDQRSYNKF